MHFYFQQTRIKNKKIFINFCKFMTILNTNFLLIILHLNLIAVICVTFSHGNKKYICFP